MKDKKGFTLIELLAVIILIGILSVLVVPNVIDSINKSDQKLFVLQEQEVEDAAKIYIEDYCISPIEDSYVCPLSHTIFSGELLYSGEIDLNVLVANDYIDEVSLKGKNCIGSVVVTNNKPDALLACGEKFISEGILNYKLIAHYPFDDFQEPTANLVLNPSGNSIANSIPGNYSPGWDSTLHSDAITVSNWTTGYNSGVPSPAIGYHAKWVYKNPDNTDPVMCFDDENNAYGLGHRWQGIAVNLGTGTSLGLQAGQTLTISWNQKSNVLNKGGYVGLYHPLISTGSNSFESNIKRIDVTAINEWQRVSFTTTISSDWDLTKTFNLYVYGYLGEYGKLWIDDVQLERKSYATQFISGTRTGIIDDVSKNNLDASLTLNTTPKWIDDCQVGEGCYNFNGSNTYIQVPDNSVFDKQILTISVWIKPTILPASTHQRIITKNGSGGYLLNIYGKRVEAYVGQQLISGPTLNENEWSYIIVTNDGTRLKFYYNGALFSDVAYTGTFNTSLHMPLNIGAENGLKNFNGNIDDVRIYNRALSESEITALYNKK